MIEFKSYCHAENCSELHNKIVRVQLEKPTEKITINANSALNFSLWVAHRLPANPSLIIEEEGKISEFAGEIKRPDVADMIILRPQNLSWILSFCQAGRNSKNGNITAKPIKSFISSPFLN